MGALRRDLRYAARQLATDRTFTVAVLVTLALAVGANVVVFAAVHSVLLEPLPAPEADRLVLIYNAYPGATGAGAETRGSNSVPHYYERVAELGDVFEEQALFRNSEVAIGDDEGAEMVAAWGVTPSFFRLMRVAPAIGRTFAEDEGEVGNEQRVVLSHGLWQRLFASDPSAVGRQMRIGGRPHDVVGVMPASFVVENPDVQLWIPLAFTEEQRSFEARHSNSWQMLGRLRAGATLAGAQAGLDRLVAAEGERFPEYRQILEDAGFQTVARPYRDAIVHEARASLYFLWAAVLFVLLIAAVNIANLLLMRSQSRVRELGIRHALGAARPALARQLVTESVLLTLAGSLLGLGAGAFGLRWIGAFGAYELPRGGEIALDGFVVGATVVAALALGALLGLVSVAGLGAKTLDSALRSESRGGTAGRAAERFRTALVVVQVSVAFVVVAGAVLMQSSYQRITSVDPGFRAEGLLTGRVALPASRYPESADRLAFAERALTALRALPGVDEVGLSSWIPFTDRQSNSVIRAVGYEERPGESLVSPSMFLTDDRYLAAMEIPLVAGRYFDSRDTADSLPAIIIDETLASRFWPGRSAVGGEMYDDVELTENTRRLRVVGVVRDHRRWGPAIAIESVGAYFLPHVQRPVRSPTFVIRGSGDPAGFAGALRAAVREIDPELPVFAVATMEEAMAEHFAPQRTPVVLALAFAGLALFLSALGSYGVLAWRVGKRTREFGIRLALGSSAASLFRLVLRDGAAVVAAGLALGLVGAFLFRGVVASQLYGVGPTDPVALLAAAVLLVAVAGTACALPARRAARLNPVTALNRE